MSTKKYTLTIEWRIEDTRSNTYGFFTGTSILQVEVRTITEAMNDAISFCEHIPHWEFKRNNIDLEQYREGNSCTVNYRTQLNKILSIEASK